MTEQEWLVSTNRSEVAKHIARGLNPRTRILFACASCRLVYWNRLPFEVQGGLEIAERYADGLASWEELDEACALARDYQHSQCYDLQAAGNLDSSTWPLAARAARWAFYAIGGEGVIGHDDAEHRAHCHFFREIGGNGFHPVTFDPAWLGWNSGVVWQMAEAIYRERQFADLPLLADALEEAGCADNVLLSHCRGPGPHVRGCWALDLILGKFFTTAFLA